MNELGKIQMCDKCGYFVVPGQHTCVGNPTIRSMPQTTNWDVWVEDDLVVRFRVENQYFAVTYDAEDKVGLS